MKTAMTLNGLRKEIKKSTRSNLAFDITLLLAGLSLFLVSIDIFSYSLDHKKRVEGAISGSREKAVHASKLIEQKLRELQGIANSIAGDISAGRLKNEQLLERAKKELEQNPEFLEVGAAYKPFAYDPTKKLYGPFFSRKTGKIQLVQIEDSYDYTTIDNEWYHKPLANGSNWAEPYYDKSSGDTIVEYDRAFYKNDPKTNKKEAIGVIYANYSLNKMKQLIDLLDLGKTGYAFVMSQKGTLLDYPNQQYVKDQKNIFDVASDLNSEQLRIAGEKAIKGENTVIDFVDNITGQPSWIFIEPIPLTKWSIGMVIIKAESSLDNQTNRRQLIWLILKTICLLFFVSILVFRAYKGNNNSLWIVASFYAGLCLTGIGLIWYIVLSERTYQNNRYLLLSRMSVGKLLEPQISLANNLKQKPPLYVPTGVFIQGVRFNTATDVFVKGYIWQRYRTGLHDGISRGFILPEADAVQIQQQYRYQENGTETIGWYFEGTIRQSFDFGKYPLEYNDVLLRIWHKDFNRQDINRSVILVPDLTAYDALNPSSRPGLDEHFVTEGWNVESTFFEYKFNNYNSNFGIANTFAKKEYPELYFTVILKRAFVGVFIVRIVPLTVVAILMFAMVLLSREHAIEVLGACAGFIFIVILDQISVRGQIVAKGIVYFEYFYFTIYLLILLVALNSILLALNKNIRLIQYKENLLPKLFYWPTMLTILLVITACVFY